MNLKYIWNDKNSWVNYCTKAPEKLHMAEKRKRNCKEKRLETNLMKNSRSTFHK